MKLNEEKLFEYLKAVNEEIHHLYEACKAIDDRLDIHDKAIRGILEIIEIQQEVK